MKKVLILFSLLVFALSASTQDLQIVKADGEFSIGGNTSVDTLIQSQTANYVIRTRPSEKLFMKLALETNEVSGTTAYTALLQSSMNNSDWNNVDTITVSGGGDKYGEFTEWVDSTKNKHGVYYYAQTIPITHNYYRVNIVATGATQRSIITIWGNARKEDE